MALHLQRQRLLDSSAGRAQLFRWQQALDLHARGRPAHAGNSAAAGAACPDRGTPVFGVCLGQQAIGYVYGAAIVGAATKGSDRETMLLQRKSYGAVPPEAEPVSCALEPSTAW